MYKPKDLTFEVDYSDTIGRFVLFHNKSGTDNIHGYNMPKRVLKRCGLCDEEVGDCMFEVTDTTLTLQQLEAALLKEGFQPKT